MESEVDDYILHLELFGLTESERVELSGRFLKLSELLLSRGELFSSSYDLVVLSGGVLGVENRLLFDLSVRDE